MQKFGAVVQDTAGNVLASTTVTVYKAGTVSVASIYSNNTGSSKANPFTNDADGSYEFYAPNGRYDIVLAKTGYSFPAANTSDVLFDDQQTMIDVAISGTTNDLVAPIQDVWRVTGSSSPLLTGVVARQNNQRLTIMNVAATSVTISRENVLSAAANRFETNNGLSIVLDLNQAARFIYDGTTLRWRQI